MELGRQEYLILSVEDIKLKEYLLKFSNCKASGKEIIEELTQPDGFDDLPF